MRRDWSSRQGKAGETMNRKLLRTGIAAVLTIVLMIVIPPCLSRLGGGRRVEAGRRPAGMAVPAGPRRPSGLPHRMVVFHGEPCRCGGRQVRVPAHVLPAGAPDGRSGPGKPLVDPGRIPGPLRPGGYPEGFLLVRRTALPLRSGTCRRPDGGAGCLVPAVVGPDGRADDHPCGQKRRQGTQPGAYPPETAGAPRPQWSEQKGEGTGQSSYYYSFTDLETRGTIRTDRAGAAVPVSGTSWFDQEFGSNQLAGDQIGWDWFGIHLSDGRDLMLYFLRKRDGSHEAASSGTLVEKSGRTRHLALAEIGVEVLSHWKSEKSGGRYPNRWRVRIPGRRDRSDAGHPDPRPGARYRLDRRVSSTTRGL